MHSQEQDRNQPEIQYRHRPALGRRNFEVALFLLGSFTEERIDPRQRRSTIKQIIKLGYFHPNQRSKANPGNQSQRDNAVTMRPPSSIPTGVRLDGFRKYPNQAKAMKRGCSNVSPRTLQDQCAKTPQHRTTISDAGFHPGIARRFLQRDERTHKWNENRCADFESELSRDKQMTGFMHEQQQDKSQGELPTPHLCINPDHQEHRPARFQQDRQEFQERKKKNLSFAKNFAITTPTTASGTRFFYPSTCSLSEGAFTPRFFRFAGSSVRQVVLLNNNPLNYNGLNL